MIHKLILHRIGAEEKRLGESLEYVRHVLDKSWRGFLKLFLFMPLANHRRKLPANAYRVARLVATRDEDCGSCVRIELALARSDRVPREVLAAVIAERPDELPPDLAAVYRFARSVVRPDGGEADLREELRALYGEEALVELAFAIAACRVFPIAKRALGYATSCAAVELRA